MDLTDDTIEKTCALALKIHNAGDLPHNVLSKGERNVHNQKSD